MKRMKKKTYTKILWTQNCTLDHFQSFRIILRSVDTIQYPHTNQYPTLLYLITVYISFHRIYICNYVFSLSLCGYTNLVELSCAYELLQINFDALRSVISWAKSLAPFSRHFLAPIQGGEKMKRWSWEFLQGPGIWAMWSQQLIYRFPGQDSYTPKGNHCFDPRIWGAFCRFSLKGSCFEHMFSELRIGWSLVATSTW